MRLVLLTLFGILSPGILSGQIRNAGFEISRDSFATLPKDWNIKKADGFSCSLDKEVKHSGASSLLIRSTQATDLNAFLSFSQFVDFEVQAIRKLTLSVYTKTQDVAGNVGLWCQVLDKNNRKIGFQNLEIQKTKIIGTRDWENYSLSIVVNSSCRKLVFGGYLQGPGQAWFDQVSVEEVQFPSAPPSKEAKKYIEHFTGTIRKYSVYSRLIDWNSLDSEIGIISRGASTMEEATVVSGYVLSRLREAGDNHSFIESKAVYESIRKEKPIEKRPYGKLLEGGIGYVYVPGFASLNAKVCESFAISIQDIIKDLDTQNDIAGWIIDLRENTGGNMYPMIAGLGPVIGEGTLGHFHNAKGKVRGKWRYSNGSTGMVKVKQPYTLKISSVKVAVLIGPKTSSSGEMTTVSFIGRPNTKLFGQASGGYTTGNSIHKLKDGSALALASSYISDRNGKQYLGKIHPDIFADGDTEAIKKAREWLDEK